MQDVFLPLNCQKLMIAENRDATVVLRQTKRKSTKWLSFFYFFPELEIPVHIIVAKGKSGLDESPRLAPSTFSV